MIRLLIVDCQHMDGIAASCALRRFCPQSSVIMVTIHDDALTQARARDAGAEESV